MPILLVVNCGFTCLKFGLPTLSGRELRLTSGCLYVSKLYRGGVGWDGIPIRQYVCIVCVC